MSTRSARSASSTRAEPDAEQPLLQRQLDDLVPAVTYVFDVDADDTPAFRYVSEACEEVYGFTAGQAVADVRLMHDAIHPADRERFAEAGRRSLETLGLVAWEGRILRTDGRERSVVITSRPTRRHDGSTRWHGVVVGRGPHGAAPDAVPDAVPDADGRPSGAAGETPSWHDAMGILGHDIGAPLAAILGYADWGLEVLERVPPHPETVDVVLRRCFEVVLRQGRRLEQLRDDLLTTAAADAGVIRARPGPVRVRPHLEVSADLRTRDLRVEVDCDGDLACLVQEGHLDQMLGNLVSNAERFARGKVRMSALERGSRVFISVEDDGPGVPPDVVDRLFARFAHVGGRAPAGSGAGLGLYIVRTLAQANDGTVVYSPSSLGARFTISLPSVEPG